MWKRNYLLYLTPGRVDNNQIVFCDLGALAFWYHSDDFAFHLFVGGVTKCDCNTDDLRDNDDRLLEGTTITWPHLAAALSFLQLGQNIIMPVLTGLTRKQTEENSYFTVTFMEMRQEYSNWLVTVTGRWLLSNHNYSMQCCMQPAPLRVRNLELGTFQITW